MIGPSDDLGSRAPATATEGTWVAIGVLTAMVALVVVLLGPALAIAWLMSGWMDH